MFDDILRAEALTKSYGSGTAAVAILDGLTLAVRPGEFVSVVGPSGCGKTTLLMCLAGLIAADAGRVLFQGHPVTATPKGVAVVFQDYSRSLLPWKRNLDNILFGMRRLTGVPHADKRDRAMNLMQAVGLAGFESHYPWQLSGGMQQRVAIARALASDSQLLLLDEPLSAVDAQTRAELQDLVLLLAQTFKQTCLLVTHDVDEAVYMADRVIVLSRRPTRVVEDIPVGLAKPRNQLETREDKQFLAARHHVFDLIRGMKTGLPAGAEPVATFSH